jgi:hypothetical protein
MAKGRYKLITAAAVSIAALVAAATSAQAATPIATITAVAGNQGAAFSLEDPKGPHGIGASLVTPPSHNIFSFIGAGLPTDLRGMLQFIGVSTTDAGTANTVGSVTTYSEGGFAGAFKEVYAGTHTVVLDGVTLIPNVTVLLSGSIANGVVTGVVDHGVSQPGTFDGWVSSYTSPYLLPVAGGFDLSLALRGGNTWRLENPAAGNALKAVNVYATGSFDAGGVPEPASWALMLVGFGGLGAMLRGSRRKPVAAA